MGNKDGWEKGERELAGYSGVRMGGDADRVWASVGKDWERESGKGTDLRGRRGEIERLRSTFLCKLTGLDAQLTGLFWQVSDGPYYYFTAEPLGPCITGHNRTGQAGKKREIIRKVAWKGSKKKNLHLTSFLCSSLALHSPTVWASFACMYVCHVCTSAGMRKSERVEKKDTDYFNFFF